MSELIETSDQTPALSDELRFTYSHNDGQWWSHRFDVTSPSDPKKAIEILPVIESQLTNNGFSDHEICQVEVAFEEAFINAAEHGNRRSDLKSIYVSCCVSPERVRVEIQDEGEGFDPDSFADSAEDENLPRAVGQGLLLMRHHMSDVAYANGGSLVTMELRKIQPATVNHENAQPPLSVFPPHDKKELSRASSEPTDQTINCDPGSRSRHSDPEYQRKSRATWHRGALHSKDRTRRTYPRFGGWWKGLCSICGTSGKKLRQLGRPKASCSLWIGAAGFSLQGSRRQKNEDRFHIAPDHTVFVLADGIGGAPAGDVASDLAVDVLSHDLSGNHAIDTRRPALRLFNDGFQHANEAVLRFGREHQSQGMGTAVVAAVRACNRIYVSGVGDCRAYLFRNRRLEQLTTDDTFADIFLKSELIDPNLVNYRALKNLLTRYIGDDGLQPVNEIAVVDLEPGDRLLMCSDGLFDALDERKIESALLDSHTAKQSVAHLKRLAKSAEARDDTTCIVIEANSQLDQKERVDSQQSKTAIPMFSASTRFPVAHLKETIV